MGQQSGVRYWNEKLNPGIVTDVTHGVGDFVIDNTERVIDTVGSGIDAIQDFGGAAAEQVGDLIGVCFLDEYAFFRTGRIILFAPDHPGTLGGWVWIMSELFPTDEGQK